MAISSKFELFGSSSVPSSCGISNTKCFYRSDVLPVTQPRVSKNWRKCKVLTQTRGPASCFHCPPSEDWQKSNYSLYASSPTPVSRSCCIQKHISLQSNTTGNSWAVFTDTLSSYTVVCPYVNFAVTMIRCQSSLPPVWVDPSVGWLYMSSNPPQPGSSTSVPRILLQWSGGRSNAIKTLWWFCLESSHATCRKKEPTSLNKIRNWTATDSRHDNGDGYVSRIQDPKDFTKWPCVKSIHYLDDTKDISSCKRHVMFINNCRNTELPLSAELRSVFH